MPYTVSMRSKAASTSMNFLRMRLMRDAELTVDDSTITSHIKRMRKKFIEVDAAFDRIDTVYGIGYRWKA